MADFKELSGKTITEAFRQFDKNNPAVYTMFCREVFRAVKLGKKKLSSKQILGHIRWEIFLQTKEATLFNHPELTSFKINDAYTAHYARKFVTDHPEHQDLFEFRKIRSI